MTEQLKSHKRIAQLTFEIEKVIDTICESEDFEIHISEINTALLDVMTKFNNIVLKNDLESKNDD